jgi:hypothetical protein
MSFRAKREILKISPVVETRFSPFGGNDSIQSLLNIRNYLCRHA